MVAPSSETAAIEALLTTIVASQKIAYLALAGFVLLVYDHFLTLEQEAKYFWSGSWSLSRVLFLLNRYICPMILLVGLVATLGEGLSYQFCESVVRAMFVMEYLALSLIQGIIVLRIWYMFKRRCIARILVVCIYIATITASGTEIGVQFSGIIPIRIEIPGFVINHCTPPPVNKLWKLYLPNLVLHTSLFAATTWPVLQQRRSSSPLMLRLVRDGGIFYVTVFAASAYTTIGSLRPNDPSVILPAIFSNFILAVSSVSVSRLMLGIHSLAAALSLDFETLLSTAELNRIQWKHVARGGELIVEIDTVEDLEMRDINGTDPNLSHVPRIHVTKVGVYNDEVVPGFHKISVPKRAKKARSRAA